jgi:hypothetical protein
MLARVVVDEERKQPLAADRLRFGPETRAARGARQDQDVEIELRQDFADEPAVGARLDVVELEELLGTPVRRGERGRAAPATHRAGEKIHESVDRGTMVVSARHH